MIKRTILLAGILVGSTMNVWAVSSPLPCRISIVPAFQDESDSQFLDKMPNIETQTEFGIQNAYLCYLRALENLNAKTKSMGILINQYGLLLPSYYVEWSYENIIPGKPVDRSNRYDVLSGSLTEANFKNDHRTYTKTSNDDFMLFGTDAQLGDSKKNYMKCLIKVSETGKNATSDILVKVVLTVDKNVCENYGKSFEKEDKERKIKYNVTVFFNDTKVYFTPIPAKKK